MSFQLVPISVTWMTLNGVMALIFAFSLNSVAFREHYVKVIEDILTLL